MQKQESYFRKQISKKYLINPKEGKRGGTEEKQNGDKQKTNSKVVDLYPEILMIILKVNSLTRNGFNFLWEVEEI